MDDNIVLMLSEGEILEVANSLADTLLEVFDTSGSTQEPMTVEISEEELLNMDLGELASTLAGLTDPIGQLKAWLSNILSSIADFITNTVLAGVQRIFDAIVDKVKSFFENAISKILSSLEGILGKIKEALLGGFESFITTLKETLRKYILDPLEKAISYAKEFIKKIPEYLTTISNVIGDIIEKIKIKISGFVSLLSDAVKTVTRKIFDIIKSVSTHVSNIISTIKEKITGFIETIKEYFGKIKDFFKDIANAYKQFYDKLIHLPEKMPEVIHKVAENIWLSVVKPVYDWLKKHIFEPLIEKFTDFYKKASNAIYLVGVRLTGFVNAILKFPEWFKEYITKPLGVIWDTLKKIPELFSKAFSKAWSIVKDAGKFILGKLLDAASWAFDKVISGLSWAIEKTIAAMKWIGEKVISTVKTVGSALWNITIKLFDWFKASISKIIKFLFIKPMTTLIQSLSEALKKSMKLVLTMGGKGGELWFLIPLIPLLLTGYTICSMPYAITAGADEMLKDIEASLEPIGLGVKVKAKVLSIFKEILRSGKEIGSEITKGVLIGLGIALMEPLRYLIRPVYKEAYTGIFQKALGVDAFLEIPAVSELRDIVRRTFPTSEKEVAEFEKAYKYLITMLRARGYPDYVIERLFMLLDEKKKTTYITVKDRFGTDRKIPLSLLYEMPSRSDLVSFMVRDMIKEPNDFIAWMAKIGVYRDTSLFYYLLHFRYPSPEKLWEFVCRAISGELWYPEKAVDENIAKIYGIEGWIKKAKAPVELNYDKEIPWQMIKQYMKWHDYAQIPWGEGWATDNAIITDLLADIPGKIDIRWMVKWGIFEEWSKYGYGVKTAIKQITEELLLGGKARKVETKIEMDIRQMCRILQSLGFHPHWVPWIAIAETINALTEERTLLRTGFINLYKEGYWTYKDLEELLKGFFYVKFRLGIYDLKDKDWKESEFYMPVMFLPPERKLLELRALMDKAHNLLRDYVKELTYAYADNIVEKIDDFDKSLMGVFAKVNDFFKSEVKEITGIERSLKLDMAYWNVYKEILKLFKDLYTTRRIRYWCSRYIGWIIYRLSYGYVDIEVAKEIVDLLAKAGKLTLEEKKLLETLIEKLVGIAVREYVPTPSQLASIVEVVPEARKLFKEVVEVRKVPKTWIPIWGKYIMIKPLLDEVKKLLSRLEDAYVYFLLSDDAYKKSLESIAKYGWEKDEIELLMKSSQLERALRAWTRVVGTPRELVTMAEYSPKARTFALSYVFKMIDALPIDMNTKKFLKEMWKEYVRNKPVYDEVRRYVTELISDYAYGVIDKLTLEKELKELEKWGVDEYERNFFLWLAEKRRQRYLARKQYGYGGGTYG